MRYNLTSDTLENVAAFLAGLAELSQETGVAVYSNTGPVELADLDNDELGIQMSNLNTAAGKYEAVIDS